MAGGRKPGTPKTGGRKKGTPNKVTADIKVLAQNYSGQAIATLARIMQHGETDTARVAAAKEILDRGYGKPKQEIEANVNLFDKMGHDEQLALAAALQALSRDESGDAVGASETHH